MKHALIVGGGPDPKFNQVSIEYNVSYVQRLLPPNTPVHVLYASGNPKDRNVQYTAANGRIRYQASNLSQIDGPSTLKSFDQQIAWLAGQPPGPVLLYFSGHGGPGWNDNYANNEYSLWNDGSLTVRHLAADLKTLPASEPVTIVMAQCYSGGFGDLLFENGSPNGPVLDRDLCGFFAAMPQREAAGCTPEVNQADYQDFTGYFFGALSGRDRLGHAVTGADYNHDGKVGMEEALEYARIHDDSIDTPICTSDVFLRRFVPMPQSEIVTTPYSQLTAWATPDQLTALNAISDQLKIGGEDRLMRAFRRFQRMDPDSDSTQDVRTYRFIVLAKTVVLAHRLQQSSDAKLKARYAALKASEARNPL